MTSSPSSKSNVPDTPDPCACTGSKGLVDDDPTYGEVGSYCEAWDDIVDDNCVGSWCKKSVRGYVTLFGPLIALYIV